MKRSTKIKIISIVKRLLNYKEPMQIPFNVQTQKIETIRGEVYVMNEHDMVTGFLKESLGAKIGIHLIENNFIKTEITHYPFQVKLPKIP